MAAIVKRRYGRGRTQASVEICKALGWVQPNGWLKDRACRDVLRVLESQGVLRLPPRKSNPEGNRRRGLVSPCPETFVEAPSVTAVHGSGLRMVQVKGTSLEPRWNSFVQQYHYLGFKVAVGRALKYLVFSDDRLIAAAGFAEAAWAVKVRDDFLRCLPWPFQEVRGRVINNSRFLIAPWARVPNLASRILARVLPRAADDWHDYYRLRPLLVETFVDTTRFTGASYKAANWHCLGLSRGFLKSGGCHSNGQTRKALYVYPLDRRVAVHLLGFMRGRKGWPISNQNTSVS